MLADYYRQHSLCLTVKQVLSAGVRENSGERITKHQKYLQYERSPWENVLLFLERGVGVTKESRFGSDSCEELL